MPESDSALFGWVLLNLQTTDQLFDFKMTLIKNVLNAPPIDPAAATNIPVDHKGQPIYLTSIQYPSFFHTQGLTSRNHETFVRSKNFLQSTAILTLDRKLAGGRSNIDWSCPDCSFGAID